MPSKLWRKSLGERGLRVYLFERTPGGTLYREVYSGGKRIASKKSLRHRDKDRAVADGYELLAKLKSKEEALQGGRLTLSQLFDNYTVSPAHEAKKPRTRREDEAKLRVVIDFLGADREVKSLCASDVERYTDSRLKGRVGRLGMPVRPRTAQADLVALKTMLNWATGERSRSGRALLDVSPLRGVKLPSEKNPRRPIEYYDRFEKLMEVAGDVDWRLPAVLTLAEATGQRIGSILKLRRGDVDLESIPHAKIRFRAEDQKTGFDHSVPLATETASMMRGYLEQLPEHSEARLFPAQRDTSKPVCVSVMSRCLRAAYGRAGVAPRPGGLWHPWRRKWATERKDMPLTDVAAAGGWRDPTTLLKCYQQPDEDTMNRVVLGASKLVGDRGEERESTPIATPVRLVR